MQIHSSVHMKGSIPLSQASPAPLARIARKTFRRAQHLRKSQDFLSSQKEGFRLVTPAFVFHYLPKPEASAARIGIVASRKVGPSVKRNLGKRWARECFRHSPLASTMPGDMVLTLRYAFNQHSYQEFEAFFNHACAKAHKYYVSAPALPTTSPPSSPKTP